MSRLYEVTVDFEVPFHDVDALRIVWHGHYYKYMELGRTALLRSRGIDVESIGEAGYRLLLVDSHCRYTYANQRFCELVGASLEEVVGHTADEFFDADTRA